MGAVFAGEIYNNEFAGESSAIFVEVVAVRVVHALADLRAKTQIHAVKRRDPG